MIALRGSSLNPGDIPSIPGVFFGLRLLSIALAISIGVTLLKSWSIRYVGDISKLDFISCGLNTFSRCCAISSAFSLSCQVPIFLENSLAEVLVLQAVCVVVSLSTTNSLYPYLDLAHSGSSQSFLVRSI